MFTFLQIECCSVPLLERIWHNSLVAHLCIFTCHTYLGLWAAIVKSCCIVFHHQSTNWKNFHGFQCTVIYWTNSLSIKSLKSIMLNGLKAASRSCRFGRVIHCKPPTSKSVKPFLLRMYVIFHKYVFSLSMIKFSMFSLFAFKRSRCRVCDGELTANDHQLRLWQTDLKMNKVKKISVVGIIIDNLALSTSF